MAHRPSFKYRPIVCPKLVVLYIDIVRGGGPLGCQSPPPLPFGRICFVVLVMRKGGKSSWSGPWHLGCTLEVFHVHHSYQDQFIQPSWAECIYFACIFSLSLCFVRLFVLFDLSLFPFFCVPLGSWVISLIVFGASVTNLNEPPRALATSTAMWVRS